MSRVRNNSIALFHVLSMNVINVNRLALEGEDVNGCLMYVTIALPFSCIIYECNKRKQIRRRGRKLVSPA